MILIYILLGILLITLAAITLMVVFGQQKSRLYRMGVSIGLAVLIVLTILCGVFGSAYRGAVNDLEDQYEVLSLYYHTVNNSDNEYVRFDYYERVTLYNRALQNNLDNANNDWTGGLYPAGWSDNLAFIDFELKGDF